MKKQILTLIALFLALTVAAQRQQMNLQAGDSIKLKRSCTHYLTGEEIPQWVYDVPMTVMQASSDVWPRGILIKEVISWVDMDAVGAKYVDGVEVSVEGIELVLVPETQPEPQPEPQPQPQPEPQVPMPPMPVPPTGPAEPEIAPEPEPQPQPVPQPEPQVQPQHEPVPNVSINDLASVKAHQLIHHRVGVGLRVGLSSFMQQLNSQYVSMWGGRRYVGGEFGVDLDYTCLWDLHTNTNVQLGVRAGLNLVYANGGIRADRAMDWYVAPDNDQLLYVVEAYKLKERQSQFMIELPVLFALHTVQGFVFYTGPKFNFPAAGSYKLTYSNPVVLAKTESGEEKQLSMSGVAPQTSKQYLLPKFNLLWDMEIGYEWKLKNGAGLGLTAYADMPVVTTTSMYTPGSVHFIQVGTQASGPTILTNSLSDSYGKWMSCADFGVKVSYIFCFDKVK